MTGFEDLEVDDGARHAESIRDGVFILQTGLGSDSGRAGPNIQRTAANLSNPYIFRSPRKTLQQGYMNKIQV